MIWSKLTAKLDFQDPGPTPKTPDPKHVTLPRRRYANKYVGHVTDFV